MKYEIFTRGDNRSEQVKKALLDKLCKIQEYQLCQNPELVIFIGGDGTFLRAVQQYLPQIDDTTFIGVHTGTLGFFCDYHETEIEQLMIDLPKAQTLAHSYRLLELNRKYLGGIDIHYAINEVRLENPFHTLVSDVYIDDVLLETFRGNGLIVASTLGSSGYNKSLGGALINTKLATMQLTEVATLQNNAYRSLGSSLVCASDEKITFKGKFDHAVIGFDHLVLENHHQVNEMTISLSKKLVHIVHQINRRYPEILRKSFIKD